MIELWHVQISGIFLLGIQVGWGITTVYYDHKFNKKPSQPKGGFVQ